jgi:hypothetical protein
MPDPSSDRDAGLSWVQRNWLDQAKAWITAQLDPLGASLTGEIEQPHVRWWSTVLRVPTSAGTLYFKAVAPVWAFEPRLNAMLARVVPDRVPEIVAFDDERGWFLMRDAGTRLRELIKSNADLYRWEELLPLYAELQIELAPYALELVALGVPDERLSVLPGHFRQLLDDRPEGLTAEEHERLLESAPEVEALCRELDSYGFPETIQHDDLHDGQIFVREGRYLFFDWGDSCVSHPFHSLVVILRAIAWKLDLEPGGLEVQRLRNAYLEPFGPRKDLVSAAELAYRTGTIARAIAHHRYVSARPDPLDEEDRTNAAYGLKLFLAGGPLGAWN